MRDIETVITVQSESIAARAVVAAICKEGLENNGLTNVFIKPRTGEIPLREASKETLLEEIAKRNPRFFGSKINIYAGQRGEEEILSDKDQEMLDAKESLEEDLEEQYKASQPLYTAEPDGNRIFENLETPIQVATCASPYYAKMFADAINKQNGREPVEHYGDGSAYPPRV